MKVRIARYKLIIARLQIYYKTISLYLNCEDKKSELWNCEKKLLRYRYNYLFVILWDEQAAIGNSWIDLHTQNKILKIPLITSK